MKSVHDMTPAELRAEVQALRDARQQEATEVLQEWERVAYRCPRCYDDGGPGNCRECYLDGNAIERVPRAVLILRRVVKRFDIRDAFAAEVYSDAVNELKRWEP